MSDEIYIDVEDGLKRVMNNESLFARLLTKFKDDTNLKELEEALLAQDMDRAKVAAHTLKGLTANLSLVELHKQSMDIEAQIKNGSLDSDKINVLRNVYLLTMEKINEVIAKYA